jgi:hypothetical protein
LGRYERAGVSTLVVPGALLEPPPGWMGRPAPIRAPPATQREISCFSAGVRIRCDWPTKSGESWPGIHGGIFPIRIMVRIRLE